MTRERIAGIATGITGTISGILLFCGVMCLSLSSGPNAMSVCGSALPPDGCPNIQKAIITAPALGSQPTSLAIWLLSLAILSGLPVWIATVIRANRRDISSQGPILISSVLATGLLIVDLIITYGQTTALPAAQVCYASAKGLCFSGGAGFLAAFVGIGWGPIVAAIVAGAPAWVMALTQALRWRQWAWLGATLLFSPVAAALYALFGIEKPATTAIPTETAVLARGAWVQFAMGE
jgi:hypothetical protein